MSDEQLIARLRKADEYEPLGHDGWEAADRIEALTEQLAAARRDAEEAEAYAGELEANGLANRVAIMRLEARAERLEALLTRAAEGEVDVSGSAIIYGYPQAGELHKDLSATLTQKDRTDG